MKKIKTRCTRCFLSPPFIELTSVELRNSIPSASIVVLSVVITVVCLVLIAVDKNRRCKSNYMTQHIAWIRPVSSAFTGSSKSRAWRAHKDLTQMFAIAKVIPIGLLDDVKSWLKKWLPICKRYQSIRWPFFMINTIVFGTSSKGSVNIIRENKNLWI